MSDVNNVKHLYAEAVQKIKDMGSLDYVAFNLLAGKLYKYPFYNQVLIFAQDNDARAVASEHIWKDIMHRDIKEDATAIAAYSNGKLVYLFDERDTIEKEGSQEVTLWNGKNIPAEKTNGSPLEKALAIARGEYMTEVLNIATNNALDSIINTLGVDNTLEYQIKVRTALRAMVALQVGSRIGDMDFNEADKLNLQILKQQQQRNGVRFDTLTPREMTLIGTVASTASRSILKTLKDLYEEIEEQMEVKNENGDNIREEGRDTLSESTDRGTADDDVYEREGDIPETGADGRLHTPDNGGSLNEGTSGSTETVPGRDDVRDVRTDGDSERLQTKKASDRTESESEIRDFGLKIGGARKDLYGTMIQYSDMQNMNEQERMKLAKKDKIWPKTDWEKVIKEGEDRTLCWWKNEMRKAASPAPYFTPDMDADKKLEIIDKYVRNMTAIRDAVMNCRTRADADTLNERVFGPIVPIERGHYSPIVYTKRGVRGKFLDDDFTVSADLYDLSNFRGTSLFNYSRISWSKFEDRAKRELFGISKDTQLHESILERSKIFRIATKEEAENPHALNMGPVGYFEEKENGDPVLVIKDNGSANFIYLKENRMLKDRPELLTAEGWHIGDYCAITEAKLLSAKESYTSYSSRSAAIFPAADRREAEINIIAYAQVMQEAYNRKLDEDKAAAKELRAENQKADPLRFHTAPLQHVRRIGDDYRQGTNMTAETYQETFGFSAGEFGNWNSQKDRQECLNAGFDAFKDLAKAIGIDDASVSLKTENEQPLINGERNPGYALAIAFGARGRGGKNAGRAHYEPERNVINLTKMKGAGSMAHEWGHALDEYIGKRVGNVNGDFTHMFTESKDIKDMPEALQNVYATMLTRQKSKAENIAEKRAAIKDTILDDMARLRPNPMSASVRDNFSTKRATACAENIKNDPEKLKAWNEAVDVLLEKEEKADPFCFENYTYGNRNNVHSGGSFRPLLELKETFLTLGGEENLRDFDKEYSDSALQTDAPLNDIAKKYNALKSAEKTTQEFFATPSNYYQEARKIDDQLCPKKPYWSTPCEMFARAFSLYVKEKMEEKDMINTYLTKDQGLDEDMTIPHGDEKKVIFDSMDKLIEFCKEQDYLKASETENELIDDEEEER